MNNDLASISDALPKKAPVRQWALGLLALSILVWLSTVYLQRLYPDWAWLGYVKAFAEAACIGGMADWFAVVALFRHPMGVPLALRSQKFPLGLICPAPIQMLCAERIWVLKLAAPL